MREAVAAADYGLLYPSVYHRTVRSAHAYSIRVSYGVRRNPDTLRSYNVAFYHCQVCDAGWIRLLDAKKCCVGREDEL